MTIHYPQAILISMLLLSFAINILLHDTPRLGKHDIKIFLIDTTTLLILLYWGGFFG